MESENNHVKIAKLKGGEDWGIWKFQMKILLISNEVYDVVTGDSVKPEAIDAAAAAADRTAYQNELKAWAKRDNNAQKYIATALEKLPMLHIINCDNSKAMWDKLHAVYENKSDVSIHALQQKWFNLTMDSKDDMSTYISKVEDLCYRLKALGETVSDSMMMTKIINTIPIKYKHFISAWESTATADKTLDNLSSRLMMEEIRETAHEASEETSALFGKAHGARDKPSYRNTRDRKSKEESFDKKIAACWYCGKKGHKQAECWSDPENKHKNTSKHARNYNKRNDRKSEALISETLLSSDLGNDRAGSWILDSGASRHMSGRREYFSCIESIEPIPVRLGDGHLVYAREKGRIDLEAYTEDSWASRHLENVLYVPEVKFNLFSMGSALEKGMTFTSTRSSCCFYKNNKVMAIGEKQLHENLFTMKFKVVKKVDAFIAEKGENFSENTNNAQQNKVNKIQLWHERFMHQNFAQVRKILTQNDIRVENENPSCDSCTLGKMHRLPFPTSETRTKSVGELIHADLCGPMEEKSIGNSRYFLLFKDDFSSYINLYFLKHKSEVKDCFENYIQRVEKETGNKVNTLRTDNGLEFVNKDMAQITFKRGIKHERTVNYTPEQNGKAERENRTLVESARTTLISKHLPKKLWAEAINTAAYVLNRTRNVKDSSETPYELWFGKKTNIIYLKVFGTDVFTHIPKEKRRKFDPKASLGIFVGYDDTVKGYRVYNKTTRKVTSHRDVRFKNEIGFSDYRDLDDKENYVIFKQYDKQENVQQENVQEEIIIQDEIEPVEEIENDNDIEEDEPIQNEAQEEIIEQIAVQNDVGRQLRNRENLPPIDRFGNNIFDGQGYDDEALGTLLFAEVNEPRTYKDAINSQDADLWRDAMAEEIEALKKNRTWILCQPPRDAKILKNRWVFKVKTGPDGFTKRHRARLVVKGFLQEEGLDYTEVFSPVARYDSVRTFLAVAAKKGMHLKQFDVKTAFLNGELEETIYMEQPQGFQGTDTNKKVCKLTKSLYGLKQAARCWNKKFTEFLKAFNLHATDADPCVFTSKGPEEQIILVIYVDDGAVASKNKTRIDKLLNYLKEKLEITISDLSMFLGIEIKYLSDGSILAHQQQYSKKVVEKFKLNEAHGVKIPADPHTSFTAFDDGHTVKVPYREAIGSLMFLAMITRPDISFAVGVLSRYAENPQKAHWNGIKRIIKYIKETSDYGLVFTKNDASVKIISFSDADYAGDVDSRRSTTGYIVKLGKSLVSWGSRKQSCVSLSTTESEFIAASVAVQEIVWVKCLLNGLIKNYNEKPMLYVDNKNAISNIKNPQYSCKTKHIDVRYKYVREKYQWKLFDLEHVSSEEQQADILTKALPVISFERLRKEIGICNESMYFSRK